MKSENNDVSHSGSGGSRVLINVNVNFKNEPEPIIEPVMTRMSEQEQKELDDELLGD